MLTQSTEAFYGLSDSGDYWDAKFKGHIKNGLKMQSTVTDMACDQLELSYLG